MNAIVAGTDELLFSPSVIYLTAATRLSGYLGERGRIDCPSENCRLTPRVMLGGRSERLNFHAWKSTLDSVHHGTCVDHYEWEVYPQQLDPVAVLC